MLVTLFLFQGSLYLSDVIGDGVVVIAGAGLHALLCFDMYYELYGVVTVQDPFKFSE